jgi:16S rRNA processing protein RimM
VEKPHGKRGEVVTVPVHGLPLMLHEGMTVACVPPALKRDRWHEVTGVTSGGGTGALVELAGVSSIADAEELAGCTILANVEDLPEGYEIHDLDALLGRSVSDEEHGHLGSISEILVGQVHDVWVIEGPYGEVLVPAVPEIVKELPAEGEILVDVPKGTIEAERS